MRIVIKPFGKVQEEVVDYLISNLENIFSAEVESEQRREIPGNSHNLSRDQYLSTAFLKELNGLTTGGEISLAVTDVDLFVPEMNFIFGEAEIGGKSAIISLARLRQDHNDGEPDKKLIKERVLKEAIHEIGHVLGFNHCSDSKCIMHFSNTLYDTDLKGPGFCAKCQAKLPVVVISD